MEALLSKRTRLMGQLSRMRKNLANLKEPLGPTQTEKRIEKLDMLFDSLEEVQDQIEENQYAAHQEERSKFEETYYSALSFIDKLQIQSAESVSNDSTASASNSHASAETSENDTQVAGSIIGKGGGNIARLRADFVAKVTVPDCPGPERILTVISTFENAVNVINEVLPNLENSSAGGRGNKNRSVAKDENSTVDDVDLRVLVHQSQAGCIIGKGGGKVKELREKTGARIKIYSNCCPDSTDRVVQLTGAGSTAIECLKEILELIRTQAPIKGPDNPYDPNNYDDYFADEYGGYGSGGGGPAFDGGRGPMRGGPVGRGPPAGRFGGGPPPRGAPLGGPPARGGYRGGGYGVDECEEELDYNMPPARGMGIGNGAGPGSRSSTQVTIPKDLAGAIIGKGGTRIRKVRIESGADITIDEPLPGSNDRIITITGLSNQIQMAQYLLQQCVHQNAKGGGGGGSRRY